MKKFYCNGKKDFCEDYGRCSTYCRYFDGSGGGYREESMTNADRIRAMSDEELAELLFQVGYDNGWSMKEYALEWLQQPAEEDDHA